MKKIFKTDKFVDYKGIERPFTVCVIYDKISDMNIASGGVISPNYDDSVDIYECDDIITNSPVISIGLSIVHGSDVDKVNPELGERIAEGRALRNATDVIVSTNHRLLVRLDLEEIADQYIKTLQNNPGVFIEGYDKMKARYLSKQSK